MRGITPGARVRVKTPGQTRRTFEMGPSHRGGQGVIQDGEHTFSELGAGFLSYAGEGEPTVVTGLSGGKYFGERLEE